jgi:hypothetical protein
LFVHCSSAVSDGSISSADTVTRDELQRREARVSAVEREVEGEKMVSRCILEQTRRKGDDVATVIWRLDRHDARFDQNDSNIGRVEAKVDGLVRSLPRMIAETMREVLDERKG